MFQIEKQITELTELRQRITELAQYKKDDELRDMNKPLDQQEKMLTDRQNQIIGELEAYQKSEQMYGMINQPALQNAETKDETLKTETKDDFTKLETNKDEDDATVVQNFLSDLLSKDEEDQEDQEDYTTTSSEKDTNDRKNNLSNVDIVEEADLDNTMTIIQLGEYVNFKDYIESEDILLADEQYPLFDDVLGPQFKNEMQKKLEYTGENGIDGGELGLSHVIVDSMKNTTCVIDYVRPGSDTMITYYKLQQDVCRKSGLVSTLLKDIKSGFVLDHHSRDYLNPRQIADYQATVMDIIAICKAKKLFTSKWNTQNGAAILTDMLLKCREVHVSMTSDDNNDSNVLGQHKILGQHKKVQEILSRYMITAEGIVYRVINYLMIFIMSACFKDTYQMLFVNDVREIVREREINELRDDITWNLENITLDAVALLKRDPERESKNYIWSIQRDFDYREAANQLITDLSVRENISAAQNNYINDFLSRHIDDDEEDEEDEENETKSTENFGSMSTDEDEDEDEEEDEEEEEEDEDEEENEEFPPLQMTSRKYYLLDNRAEPFDRMLTKYQKIQKISKKKGSLQPTFYWTGKYVGESTGEYRTTDTVMLYDDDDTQTKNYEVSNLESAAITYTYDESLHIQFIHQTPMSKDGLSLLNFLKYQQPTCTLRVPNYEDEITMCAYMKSDFVFEHRRKGKNIDRTKDIKEQRSILDQIRNNLGSVNGIDIEANLSGKLDSFRRRTTTYLRASNETKAREALAVVIASCGFIKSDYVQKYVKITEDEDRPYRYYINKHAELMLQSQNSPEETTNRQSNKQKSQAIMEYNEFKEDPGYLVEKTLSKWFPGADENFMKDLRTFIISIKTDQTRGYIPVRLMFFQSTSRDKSEEYLKQFKGHSVHSAAMVWTKYSDETAKSKTQVVKGRGKTQSPIQVIKGTGKNTPPTKTSGIYQKMMQRVYQENNPKYTIPSTPPPPPPLTSQPPLPTYADLSRQMKALMEENNALLTPKKPKPEDKIQRQNPDLSTTPLSQEDDDDDDDDDDFYTPPSKNTKKQSPLKDDLHQTFEDEQPEPTDPPPPIPQSKLKSILRTKSSFEKEESNSRQGPRLRFDDANLKRVHTFANEDQEPHDIGDTDTDTAPDGSRRSFIAKLRF